MATYLKNHGHEVLNPALPDDDFDQAVTIAQAQFDGHHPDVVVGSSRGGAVAMNIDSGLTPLVLLCPAWKRWGTARTVKPGTTVLGYLEADGWEKTETVWFVDKTGHGHEWEPALTVEQFKRELRAYILENPGHGFGITEEGEFQVHVSAFRPVAAPSRNRRTVRPVKRLN